MSADRATSHTAPPRLPDVIAGFRRRAEAGGLLDIAYTAMDTPIGPLLLAATDAGLVAVAFSGKHDDTLNELAMRLSPRILEAPGRLDAVRRELDAYFEGQLQDFSVPLDWSLVGSFSRRVLERTARLTEASEILGIDQATLYRKRKKIGLE